jgi:hypothetical protein
LQNVAVSKLLQICATTQIIFKHSCCCSQAHCIIILTRIVYIILTSIHCNSHWWFVCKLSTWKSHSCIIILTFTLSFQITFKTFICYRDAFGNICNPPKQHGFVSKYLLTKIIHNFSFTLHQDFTYNTSRLKNIIATSNFTSSSFTYTYAACYLSNCPITKSQVVFRNKSSSLCSKTHPKKVTFIYDIRTHMPSHPSPKTITNTSPLYQRQNVPFSQTNNSLSRTHNETQSFCISKVRGRMQASTPVSTQLLITRPFIMIVKKN